MVRNLQNVGTQVKEGRLSVNFIQCNRDKSLLTPVIISTLILEPSVGSLRCKK